MKKNYFAIVFVLFLLVYSHKSQAQEAQLGVSGGITFPFIDFAESVSSGFGGSVIFKYFVNKNIALGGNLGYYVFPGREINFGLGFGGLQVSPDVKIVPINATAEIFFGRSDLRPRIGVDFGAYIVSSSDGTNSQNKAYFGFAPVIGSGVIVSKNVEIFANTKFHVILTNDNNDIPTTSYLSVNAGLMFNIGN
ncbi:MAG: hypothetical protein EAZ55_14385 [Cytophagales bacterium]|nr:MAG: hypothetical protein EAZ55_14385 [Cytophagales bacterium]